MSPKRAMERRNHGCAMRQHGKNRKRLAEIRARGEEALRECEADRPRERIVGVSGGRIQGEDERMKTVTFEDDRVMTLRQVAEKIAPSLGWRTFDVSPRSGTINFTSGDARAYQMNLSGTAFAIRDGVVSPTGDCDESVDIAEELDIPHLVWGQDADGEWVAVCG